MKFILGRKIGMSQIFNKEGNIIPVTVIEAGPCFVTQIKSGEKDGYGAIQIGFEKLKEKKIKKTQKGKSYRYLREFKGDISKHKVGDKIDVSVFVEGDKIRISGISKGKGFQGVVKRHGFSGGPASHGHRHVLRRGGSIGTSFPERVIKGRGMPGRTGGERATIRNLKIAVINPENNLLAVSGAIPGPISGLVEIMSI
jgi:large subunit ribosomal protein L3